MKHLGEFVARGLSDGRFREVFPGVGSIYRVMAMAIVPGSSVDGPLGRAT
jgi:hypothetical protein